MTDQRVIITPNDPEFFQTLDSTRMGEAGERVNNHLNTWVVGQERAARFIGRDIDAADAGMKDPRQPLGVYVLAGPTGVGKTLCAEETARAIIPVDRDAEPPFTKIDCGSFDSEHRVASLIGSPPGYVNSNEPALLSQMEIDKFGFRYAYGQWAKTHRDEVPRNLKEDEMKTWLAMWYKEHRAEIPPAIILLDEIEKAHPRLQQMLLSVIDKARLGMSKPGEFTLFGNAIIFLTCNIGQAQMQNIMRGKTGKLGFGASHEVATLELKDGLMFRATVAAMKEFWPAEFVGRISDGIIVFRQLNREQARQALETTMLYRVIDRAAKAKIPVRLEFSDKFIEFLLDEGISVEYGLRYLAKTVVRYVNRPLAAIIGSRQVDANDIVRCRMTDGRPDYVIVKAS